MLRRTSRVAVLRGALALVGATAVTAASVATAAPAAAPKLPKAGCSTFTDAKGDGSIGSYEPVDTLAGDSPTDPFGVGLPNDPDLDIVDVTFNTTATAFRVLLHIDRLADTSSTGAGNVWRAEFGVNGKSVVVTAYGPGTAADDAAGALGFSFDPVAVNGKKADVGMTLVQDVAHSYVVIELARRGLETAVGPLATGTSLKDVLIRSAASYALGFETADVAKPPATGGYQIGVDPCFPTAQQTLLTLKVAKAGSKRTVSATLLDAARHPIAGQRIAWFVNGRSAGGSTTSATGVATFAKAKPGQTVKAEFAGVADTYLPSSATTKA